MEINPKYRGRIKAAWWSKTLLAIAAAISVFLLLCDFDWWTALIVAGVIAVTVVEFRVYRSFVNGDVRAPDLGFRSQSCFAVAIMLYGLYHAFHPISIDALIPSDARSIIDQSTIDQMQSVCKYGYITVGMLGGLSQFWLAWYYRGAKTA